MRQLTDDEKERLLQYMKTVHALKNKSNAELADLMTEYVWANVPLSSPVSHLLMEVIERLNPTPEEE